jgi:hypothetical protein
LSGSNDQIAAGSNDKFAITAGLGNVVTAGLNDFLTDRSAGGTYIDVKANVGTLKIADLAADATGVIDLLNGVGGYKSPAQAFAALTSDGAGGAKLSLGASGAIDFLSEPPSSLSAAHFKIG